MGKEFSMNVDETEQIAPPSFPDEHSIKSLAETERETEIASDSIAPPPESILAFAVQSMKKEEEMATVPTPDRNIPPPSVLVAWQERNCELITVREL